MAKKVNSKAAVFKPAAEKTIIEAKNIATDADLRRFMVLITSGERKYEEARAAARAAAQEAKAKIDKLYGDAVEVLQSRGVTKRVLKMLYEMSKRDEDELKTEWSASVWAIRASGLPVGAQLTFWDEPTPDDKMAQYKKARDQGYEDGLAGKSLDENPFDGNESLTQAYVEGRNDGQEAIIEGRGQAN